MIFIMFSFFSVFISISLYDIHSLLSSFFFFFNDTAPTEISPLPLHDPLPIFLIELAVGEQKHRVLFTGRLNRRGTAEAQFRFPAGLTGSYQLRYVVDTLIGSTEYTQAISVRSEEHTSELQSHLNLVCRLLLET